MHFFEGHFRPRAETVFMATSRRCSSNLNDAAVGLFFFPFRESLSEEKKNVRLVRRTVFNFFETVKGI